MNATTTSAAAGNDTQEDAMTSTIEVVDGGGRREIRRGGLRVWQSPSLPSVWDGATDDGHRVSVGRHWRTGEILSHQCSCRLFSAEGDNRCPHTAAAFALVGDYLSAQAAQEQAARERAAQKQEQYCRDYDRTERAVDLARALVAAGHGSSTVPARCGRSRTAW